MPGNTGISPDSPFTRFAFHTPQFKIILCLMLHERTELKRLLMMPLAALGVLAMLVEEFLWDMLVAFGNFLGSLETLHEVEARLKALPPPAASFALLAPVALIFPVKLLAVYTMATGHFGLGLLVLLSAKIIGTALVARIYTLCEPALLTMHWFVRIRGWVIQAKNWAHRKLDTWVLYRLLRRAVNRARTAFRRFFHDAQELG